MRYNKQASIALSVLLTCVAAPALSDCGFCAREVTLSEGLAECYLNRVDEELERVLQDKIEFHLVELAVCSVTRGGNPMPEPVVEGGNPQDIEVDESFLIPVSAMRCLAESLAEANFEKANAVRIEVRSDC